MPFTEIDLSHMPAKDVDIELEKRLKDIQANHDLVDGSIFRCVYVSLGEKSPDKLFITIHHMAIDGLSWRILLEDIVTAYETRVTGREIQLPAKTTSFKQWTDK